VKETNIKNSKISQAAANLFPGYFALVMATGIISIALAAWLLTFIGLIHSLLPAKLKAAALISHA